MRIFKYAMVGLIVSILVFSGMAAASGSEADTSHQSGAVAKEHANGAEAVAEHSAEQSGAGGHGAGTFSAEDHSRPLRL